MKKIAIYLSFLCIAGLMLLKPQVVSQSVQNALLLCANGVIPSLFPMLVVTQILQQLGAISWLSQMISPLTKKLLHISPQATQAWLAGIFGGYPTGAKSAAMLYRNHSITKEECAHIGLFCNHASPAMVIVFTGVLVFGSIQIGLLLWCSHIISSVLLGILIRPKYAFVSNKQKETKTESLVFVFTKAIKDCTVLILQICGFVIIFQVIQSFIPPQTPKLLQIMLCGTLELTSGLSALQTAYFSRPAALMLCSYFLAFGGLCASAQVISVLLDAGIMPKKYILYKFFHAILSVLITMSFYQISQNKSIKSVFLLFFTIIVMTVIFFQQQKAFFFGKKDV